MFFILGVLFVAVGALPLIRTIKNLSSMEKEEQRVRVIRGVVILFIDIVLLVAINAFFYYFVEFLWFKELGYTERFWTELSSKIALYFIGGLFAFIFQYINYRIAFKELRMSRYAFIALPISGVIGFIIGFWTQGFWQRYLLFANQAGSTVTDPIFGKGLGFYLFSIPFLMSLISFLMFLFLLTAAVILVIRFLAIRYGNSTEVTTGYETVFQFIRPVRKQISILVGLFLLMLAVNTYLSIFELMHSTAGVVTGIGWTDLNIRVPAHVITIVVYVVAAVLVVLSGFSDKVQRKLFFIKDPEGDSTTNKRAVIPVAIVVAIVVLLNTIVPGIVQSTVVAPNEVTMESRFIRNNIDMTRAAYSIETDRIQEQNFEIGRDVTPELTRENESTLDNIRLWDWQALLDNLQQQQEIRLYYQFHDVDIDRYWIDGEYRQVMLSVREMELNELDPSSQTWISRHFKYTHGYGLVLLPAHEVLEQGRPNLLVKNIPPEVSIPGLTVNRPEIYFGERTREHVYVKTDTEEFDYPSGDENIYTTYEGEGGIELSNFLRRFIFAWKFDGYQQLFSGYINKESRLLIRRLIRERTGRLAPFLILDRDPYPVLTREGRVKYIIDGYTATGAYPYSERYRGGLKQFYGANYIRNSVKVVVDAYEGTVDYYVMDEADILLNTYKRVFPGLFKPFEEMPDFLKDHIRYPVDLLSVQAEIYKTYHMKDVPVFYQREDVWEIATERYRDNFKSVDPYYVMVDLPGEEGLEFVLMLPFTPKEKNVMNAWMAGRSDIPNYGKLMVFPFPKGVEVLGPRHIEARIDQDTEMSRALSLWSQRGSEVIRGNLLAIPLFSGNSLYIMFAEPIFLQAQDAQLPELKRVALADQTRVVWDTSFEGSLRRLVGTKAMEQPEDIGAAAPVRESGAAAEGAAAGVSESLIQEAVSAFENYKEHVKNERFDEAGKELQDLSEVMKEIQEARSNR